MLDHATLLRILDRARWAPSGDNTQPWRFEIASVDHLVVHGFDTRDHVVYDLDGHPSQLAVGALLETIVIAASAERLTCRIERRPDTPETHLLIDVRFEHSDGSAPDPLAPFIEQRVVQRRPMSPRPLTVEQKSVLTKALPAGYSVVWFEGWEKRYRMARLLFDNAKIRLNIPEAYQVHKAVIEWGARYSEDRIPSQAVGVDPLTERLMQWAMARWERIEFLNKWLLGDLAPRIQLDLLPGLFCAAHFALLAPASLRMIDDYLAAGRAMQRFWLTASSLGLLCQPEMTPVIFARYNRNRTTFTNTAEAIPLAASLHSRLKHALSAHNEEHLFFLARIGNSPRPVTRSTRLPLKRLLISTLK